MEIDPHHQAMVRQSRKRREKAGLLRRRKIIAEPPFAWIKRHLEFWRWTVKGLANVRPMGFTVYHRESQKAFPALAVGEAGSGRQLRRNKAAPSFQNGTATCYQESFGSAKRGVSSLAALTDKINGV
ncbi:MAG: hypothetical protein ACOZF2_05380 [Thermodesulfobacteriota bacterium]